MSPAKRFLCSAGADCFGFRASGRLLHREDTDQSFAFDAGRGAVFFMIFVAVFDVLGGVPFGMIP